MPDRIAVIHARWHAQIVDQGCHALLESLGSLGVCRDRVDRFAVPGSYEIPLCVQRLAATGRYAAIVAAGLVVYGGIYRHDFVADAVVSGLMRVQLDSGVPVVSMVLAPHHFHIVYASGCKNTPECAQKCSNFQERNRGPRKGLS